MDEELEKALDELKRLDLLLAIARSIKPEPVEEGEDD